MQKIEKNIVILISGNGSNMAAIVQAAQKQQWREKFGARVACVVSNRPQAEGLLAAAQMGTACAVVDHQRFDSREAFDAALAVKMRMKPASTTKAGW